jgi:hypothetical protein
MLFVAATHAHGHAAGGLIAYLTLAVTMCFVLIFMGVPLVSLYRHRAELCPRFAVLGECRGQGNLIWEGARVNHMCRTIFVIWNGGSRKITASDIAEDDPIHIGISGVLLDYTLFQPAPGVRVKRTGNVLELVIKGLVGPGPPGDDDDPHVVGLQIVHDSGAWVPTVSGQIGDISLADAVWKDDHVVRRRPAVADIIGARLVWTAAMISSVSMPWR